MKSGILTIMKKELARFFGDKRTVAGVLLPGVMIYVLYSFMGTAMGSVFGVEEDYVPSIQAVRLPQSIAALADSAGMALTEGEEAGLPAALRPMWRSITAPSPPPPSPPTWPSPACWTATSPCWPTNST